MKTARLRSLSGMSAPLHCGDRSNGCSPANVAAGAATLAGEHPFDRSPQCRGADMPESERSLAVFIDFENLALGFQGRRERFDIVRVLERIVEKGKIVAKKAYADWSRFGPYTGPLHEAAIELIEIPKRSQTGKNSADIRLCVDAMDMAYSKEHID